MTILPILLELQSVHDNLRTIERDLSAYPPDMSSLDAELKTSEKKMGDLEKALAEAQAKTTSLAKDLAEARILEDHARRSVKTAASKVQYTSAIRELDTRERATTSVQKPLATLQERVAALAGELETLKARRQEAQAQFAALQEIFLSEHENQVTARGLLEARKTTLEASMPAQDLVKFTRLLAARQGQALAAVEAGACTGCRTRLRIPLMSELRDRGLVLCESCQRFLYLPPKA